MTKQQENRAFAKMLKEFPKAFGRVSFRERLMLRTAFTYVIEEIVDDIEKENVELKAKYNRIDVICKIAKPREKRIEELEQQIEKLIDFVLSKTECCDVCPITDTCINSEGTCPYAGILAKGEKEVTREWLMQFISRR